MMSSKLATTPTLSQEVLDNWCINATYTFLFLVQVTHFSGCPRGYEEEKYIGWQDLADLFTAMMAQKAQWYRITSSSCSDSSDTLMKK
jgi:hypothetical protein